MRTRYLIIGSVIMVKSIDVAPSEHVSAESASPSPIVVIRKKKGYLSTRDSYKYSWKKK